MCTLQFVIGWGGVAREKVWLFSLIFAFAPAAELAGPAWWVRLWHIQVDNVAVTVAGVAEGSHF